MNLLRAAGRHLSPHRRSAGGHGRHGGREPGSRGGFHAEDTAVMRGPVGGPAAVLGPLPVGEGAPEGSLVSASPSVGNLVAEGRPERAQAQPVALVVGAQVLEFLKDHPLPPPPDRRADGPAHHDGWVLEQVKRGAIVSGHLGV